MKYESQLQITTAAAVPPLTVNQTALVTNFNADLLDGQHGAYYATAASLSGYLPLTGGTLTGGLSGTTGSFSGALSISGTVQAGFSRLKVLDYNNNGTPTNGIRIATNIPQTSGVGMYTLIFEGYRYGDSNPEMWAVSFYIYNAGAGVVFYNVGGTCWGGKYPSLVQLGWVGGLANIFILTDLVYFRRFTVRAVAGNMSESTSHFEGWSASDSNPTLASATGVVTVPFNNEFGNVAVKGALSSTGAITQAGNQVVHAGNVSTYALPIGGGTLAGNLTINGHLTMGSGYQHRASDGSAAAPGYSFNAETGTGMYRSGTNTLAFATGGVLRASIDGSGNLTATGAVTATNFSGPGTGLTGTAAGLSIGGSAVQLNGQAASYYLNAGNLNAGTLLAARLPAFTGGDVTSTAGTVALTLANSGVTAGTYTKVTVDAKGRVTTGALLASADLPTYTGTITSSQVTTALGFTPYNATNPSGYITNTATITGYAGGISVSDSRAVVTTPQSINMGVVFDFKQNTTEGLSDGGTYFGEMTFRQYGSTTDWSGGLSHQLGFTDNGNVWQRSGSSTTWGAWKKLLDATNFSSHALPLSGGTLTGQLISNSKIETTGVVTGSSFSGAGTGLTGTAASLTAGAVPWTGVTGKPTTLAGYGITDALDTSGAAQTKSGNLTVNSALTSGGAFYAATTVQYSNRQQIYTIYYGGAQDLNWKKIADITIGTGLYRGVTFKVDVVDNQGNFGFNSSCFTLTYFATCIRSGGVQDDYNNAVVTGPVADYVRVVKTATGVYELQIRQLSDWQTYIFTAEATINSGGNTVTYASGTPANGSTTGTIYTATPGWTSKLANISVAGSGSFAGQITSTVATGTAPLVIASTTLVSNLNAQYLNGQLGSYYQNASNLNAGTVPAAQMPAHTGDVTSTAGSVALTIANDTVTNAKLKTMGAGTIKGNNGAVANSPSDLTAAQVATMLSGQTMNIAGSSTSCTGNAASASSVPWSGITSKPTTLSGYGITDALPLSGGTLTGNLALNTGVIFNRGSAPSITNIQCSIFNELNGIGSAESLNFRAYAGFKWQYWDGSATWMQLTSSGLTINGNNALHAGNYGGYSTFSGTVTGSSFSGAGTGLTGTAASLTAGAVPWSGVTGKPTTLSGYGITDAMYQVDPNGFTQGDINGSGNMQRLWGTDSVQNLIAFRPPTTVEYTVDGVNWVATTISNDVFDGKVFGKWAGFNMNVGSNIGAWTKVRMTWVNFGYHFFSHFTLAHSTNGHSMNFVFYKSDLNGVFSSEAYRVNGISSWPGYTFTSHVNVSGWWDTRDVRMVFELNGNNGPSGYPNNAINIGHIGIMGGYSSFNRVFDWDGSRNITLYGTLTVPSAINANGGLSGTTGTFSGVLNANGGVVVNNNAGVRSYYGSDTADYLGYGVQFGRVSSYLRPTTNRVASLYVGDSAINSADWANINFYSSGTFAVNNNTIIHAGNYTSYPPARWATARTISLTGDVTGTSGGFDGTANLSFAATIANSSVTFAKIQNITAYTVLGNSSPSATQAPAALSMATLAGMLSNQTMNVNGSSASCTGNAATSTKSNSIVYPFLNTSLDLNTSGGSNEITAFNAYYPSGGAYNQPIAGSQHFKVLQFGRYDSVDSNFWRGQMAMSFYEDRMWFRRENALTWQSWREFVHSGNVGSYALPITGGTVTGNSGVLLASTNDARFNIQSGTAGAWLDIRSETLGYAAVNLYGNTVSTGRWSAGMTGGNSNYRITSGAQGAGTVFMEMNSSTNATNFPNALQQNGNQVVHAGNYTSYVMKYGGAPGVDLNTLTTAGVYRIHNTEANRPNDYGQLLVMYGGSDTITQIYGHYADGTLKTRSGNPTNVGGSGTYTAWRTLLADHNYSNYALPLSGGTLTGALTSNSKFETTANVIGGNFSGPGTGLTGTAASLTAGSANAIADGTVSTSAKIAASVVTYAKIQNVSVSTVLGNSSASVAQAPVEISMASLAGMLSGQTMNINGSSASCTGNAATSTNGFTVKPGWAGAQNLIADLANFNNSVPSGFYQYSGATNSPTATWYNLINVRHSNTGNDHGFQLAMSYYDEVLWSRTYSGGTGANNGTFTTWRAHLHSGNYSSYALPLTGGTVSGQLVVSATTDPAILLNGGSSADTSTHLYTAIGGVGKVRIQRNGIIAALGLSIKSGADVNGATEVFSVSNAGAVVGASFSGAGTGLTGTAASLNIGGSAGSVAASGITGQTGMWTSAARPGPYRLYRRDVNDAYSVQNYWTGTYWRLDGYYSNDTVHAGCSVAYADTAGSASSASSATNSTQLNGQAASYYENRDTTAVGISAGTLTLTRAAGNLTTTIGGRVVAWCDFNGNFASTQTPNANFNVSSITKNATGDYTVNFSSALANANYVVAGSAQLDAPSPGQSTYNVMVAVPRRSGAKATGSCRIVTEYPLGVTLYDSVSVGVAFIAA